MKPMDISNSEVGSVIAAVATTTGFNYTEPSVVYERSIDRFAGEWTVKCYHLPWISIDQKRPHFFRGEPKMKTQYEKQNTGR